MAFPLGPYTLLAPVARGGMGEVWSARDARGTRLAIKVLTHDHPTLREAMQREIQVVAGLDHPGIAPILDAGVAEEQVGTVAPGSPWFVMPWLPGGTLHDEPPMDWDELREVLLGLLAALAHAHARGVLHRDVKPANVLLDAARNPALVDFGIGARRDHADTVDLPARGGTPGVMAPEQSRGWWWAEGPWTDLYAVGLAAWSLASGRAPFVADTVQIWRQIQDARDLPALRPRFPVPTGFEGWIARCSARDPLDRYRFAPQAARALESLEEPWTAPMVRPRASLLAQQADTWAPSIDGLPAPPPGPAADPAPPVPPAPELPAEPPAVERRHRPWGLGLIPLRPVPLVGRTSERHTLWEALREVSRGAVRAVVIEGQPGVGKSHLARWLADAAAELGAAWPIRVRARPEGGGGVEEAVEDLLQLADIDEDEECRRIAAQLPGLADDALALRRGQLSPERRSAVQRQVIARRAGGPVLLWVDDAHADAQVVRFVRDWLEAGDPPALALLTVREDLRAANPQADLLLDGLPVLRLRPLDPPDQATLIHQVLPCAPVLVDDLVERARGYPLFALHLLLGWIRTGQLQWTEEGWVRAPGAKDDPPAAGTDAWVARADEIATTPGWRTGLDVLVALGLEARLGEWSAICRTLDLEPPLALIARLAAEGLATLEPEQDRVAFAHALLRDALLERVPARIHAACAAWLEPRDAAADRCGWHHHRAGAVDQAVEAMFRAADWWGYRDLDRQQRVLDQALAWTEDLPDVDERRVRTRVRRARIAYLRGDHALVDREAQRMQEWAAAHHDREHLRLALHLRGLAALARMEPEQGLAWLRLALEAADTPSRRQRVLGEVVSALMSLGRYVEAADTAAEALALPGFDQETHDWIALQGVSARIQLGRLDEAERELEVLGPAVRAGRSDIQTAQLETVRAELAVERGDLASAEEAVERALQHRDAVGLPSDSTRAFRNLVALWSGRAAEKVGPEPFPVLDGNQRALAAELAVARGDWARLAQLVATEHEINPTRVEARAWWHAVQRAREEGRTDLAAALELRAARVWARLRDD